MIDNIVADHLLLSDYQLERWLSRYSQKSGGGVSGNSFFFLFNHTRVQPIYIDYGGGVSGNSWSLVTKVQMEKLGVCRKLLRDHRYPHTHPTPSVTKHIPNVANNASPHPSTFSSTSAPSPTPMIGACSRCVVGVSVTATAVSVCQADSQHLGEQWYPAGILSTRSRF